MTGEVVAIIPARGGSQGVPRKNLRTVAGVPLVARAIQSALATPAIDRVVVSTDDAEIAAMATRFGAEVIARPAGIAGSTATSESALLHALEVLDARGIATATLVFLQCTSPFIDPADLGRAIALAQADRDSVFSAVETHDFLWELGDGGALGVNHDHSFRQRRQDRQPQFRETGAFYVMRAAGFREAGFRFFGQIGIVPVAERLAIDIDTEQQLALAEAMAPRGDGGAASGPATVWGIDAVVTDFDGVHTDDRVMVNADGTEFVVANRSDGMGVRLLREAGVPVMILSTEENLVVSARAAKLRIEARQGIENKAVELAAWAEANGLELNRVAYLGNDLNDLGCLDIVGWPVAVADAHPAVIAAARLVLTRRGGDGAVRELAELVLDQENKKRNTP